MKTAIVIPARLASTRLPRKVLLRDTGQFLVQHVYEQARRATCATDVVVAADSDEVAAAVRSFGGRVVLTNPNHPSGTDRVAEVAAGLDADLVVNVQGDEPQIDPAAIDRLAALLAADPACDMATLAVPLPDDAAYRDPNVVKVVCCDAGRAMYFSRSPVPSVRDGEPDFAARPPLFLQHLGVYAYRRPFLLRFPSLPPHPLERLEKLEQLRVLAAGGKIAVGVVEHAHRGIDTPADYAAFVADWHAGGSPGVRPTDD